MAQDMEQAVSTSGEEPAWKQRAVERSTRAAKHRAEQRVQRFLDAAQAIMREKGTTDFTVQEIVDHSRQSLRSFYQHFSGKHELLLALLEEAMSRAASQIRAAAGSQSDPLERLRIAVELLFELSRPDPTAQRPLFTVFAPQLLVYHPTDVQVAYDPLLVLFTELLTQAQEAGEVRAEVVPARMAAMTVHTVMYNARSSAYAPDNGAPAIEAEDLWDFCARGFTGA